MSLRSLAVSLALLTSTFAFAQSEGDGRKEESREVGDFHGVAVGHGIRAEVKPGPKSVRLVGAADQLSRVELEVEDGVLTTRVRSKGLFGSGIKDVRLFVTSPEVTHVAASGGARVDAQATAADAFSAAASGGAELEVTGVDSKRLEVTASGGAEVEIKGRASAAELSASGGSVIEVPGLSADTLEVHASGGARLEAHSARSLSGALSGGSTLKLEEKPQQSEVNTSGGSRVEY
jgi:hypothetical protein